MSATEVLTVQEGPGAAAISTGSPSLAGEGAPAAAAAPAGRMRTFRLGDRARSALLRASRTFLQSFLAVVTAGPILNFNVSTVKAGGAAGLAAVLALLQRWLDETPVPTIPTG